MVVLYYYSLRAERTYRCGLKFEMSDGVRGGSVKTINYRMIFIRHRKLNANIFCVRNEKNKKLKIDERCEE